MAPEIDGKLYLSDLEPPREAVRSARPGDMVTVEITETHEYDLVGRVVEIRECRARDASPAVAPARAISTGAALRVLACAARCDPAVREPQGSRIASRGGHR